MSLQTTVALASTLTTGLAVSPAHAYVDTVIVRAAAITPAGEAPVIEATEVERIASAALAFAPLARPMSREERFQAGLDDSLRDCGYDVECITAAARATRARWVLLTIVNLELSPALVASRLVDVGTGSVVAEQAGPVLDGGRIGDLVLSQVLGVLAAGRFDVGGRLSVRPVPAEAKVDVRPPAADPFAGELLPPGAYDVLVSHDGYESASRSVTITAGAETKLELGLEASSSVVSSPWLWIALAVVVAGAAAAGIGVAVTSGESVVDFCHARSETACN